MERPTKKVRKVRKGEKDKKEKKVLVKSQAKQTKKTKKTKTKSSRPKKPKQPSMLELLLLQQQQRPQATGLMPQMPQMPINPAMIGNIRDRVSNLQKSSGSVVSEWVKLKALLNDAKTAYSNGTLDENDIEELYKQAKKLGKSGFRTYQDLLATYTTAKGAYDFFVKYLNRNTPEGERNFQPPSPPPQPDNQAPDNQAPPPPQAPDNQPPDNQPPSPSPQAPPNIPQSNTNYFYDKASQALNAINPLGGITGVEGGLLVGALGTAYQMRNLMNRNTLNRDIQVNQERGGRLANQIQQTAVQGLGNALAEQIPRAGVNSLRNLQQQINSDISEMDGILEGLDQAQTDLTRQHNIARSEAQRQLREQQRRPSLRETNREQVARQNLGEIERQTDVGRQSSLDQALERVASEGTFEKIRKKKTPEQRAEITRKAKETRLAREQMEERLKNLGEGLEAEYPSMEGLDRIDSNFPADMFEERLLELQQDD